MRTQTATDDVETTRLFGPALLKEIQKTAPAKERVYRDTQCAKFRIRHFPTGRATYAVEFARNIARTLGDVSSWKDAATARARAQTLLSAYALTGVVPSPRDVERPDAPAVVGLTVVEVFGLRARYAADGVEIAGRYRSRQRNGRRLLTGHLEALFDRFVLAVGASRPFAALTQADVQRWVAAEAARINPRTGVRAKDASVVRVLADLRTAFGWATTTKIDGVPLIAVNPAVGVVVEKTETVDRNKTPRFLNDEEEARLFAALEARDAALLASSNPAPSLRRDGCVYADALTPLVTLAVETGGRRGALFNLQWRHLENLPIPRVHFEGCFQKAGQTYYVPLSLRAQRVLRAWKPVDAAPSDLVFPSLVDGVKTSTPDSWYRLLKKIGLVGFRWHDLRHTFASKLVQRGVPLKQVSVWMGHSSIRMTERYAHLDAGQGWNVVELLARPLVSFAPPRVELVETT